MKEIKQGDPCRVRIHTGKIIDAVYDERTFSDEKRHWVYTKQCGFMIAGSVAPRAMIYCRFIGPAGVRS
jgi:hypothetical protein